jgi:hypothetical protein
MVFDKLSNISPQIEKPMFVRARRAIYIILGPIDERVQVAAAVVHDTAEESEDPVRKPVLPHDIFSKDFAELSAFTRATPE